MSVDTSGAITVGNAKPFSSVGAGNYGRVYDPVSQRVFDISPDGTRLVSVVRGSVGLEGLSGLVVVENWFEELRRLVPTP